MAKYQKGGLPLGLLFIPCLSLVHFPYNPLLATVLHSKLLVVTAINPDDVESCYNFFHLLFSWIHALYGLKESSFLPGAKKWKRVCAFVSTYLLGTGRRITDSLPLSLWAASLRMSLEDKLFFCIFSSAEHQWNKCMHGALLGWVFFFNFYLIIY